MEFLSILICLAIEKWTNGGKLVRQYNFFSMYIRFIILTFHDFSQRGYLGLMIFLLPMVALVGFVNYLLASVWFGFYAFLFSVIVLLYCLGSFDDNTSVVVMEKPNVDPEQKKVETILLQSQRNIFSVIFWYFLLGPAGAVFYRFTERLSQSNNRPSIVLVATQLQQCLAWIPVRLQTLSFALVSHFMVVMQTWFSRLFMKVSHNDEMLLACGFAALQDQIKNKNNIKEAAELVDRALVIWLVVLALIVLV